MVRLEKEVVKTQKKREWISYLYLVASVATIVFFPLIIYYVCSLYFPAFTFNLSFPTIHIHFDPFILMIGGIVLFLFVADLLLRNHLHRREN